MECCKSARVRARLPGEVTERHYQCVLLAQNGVVAWVFIDLAKIVRGHNPNAFSGANTKIFKARAFLKGAVKNEASLQFWGHAEQFWGQPQILGSCTVQESNIWVLHTARLKNLGLAGENDR